VCLHPISHDAVTPCWQATRLQPDEMAHSPLAMAVPKISVSSLGATTTLVRSRCSQRNQDQHTTLRDMQQSLQGQRQHLQDSTITDHDNKQAFKNSGYGGLVPELFNTSDLNLHGGDTALY